MLDYHLHLWPHGQRATGATVEELAAYCERAADAGVEELALTEHLFRFEQADALLGGWWEDEPDDGLRQQMAAYWHDHVSADLDAYVETCLRGAGWRAARQGRSVSPPVLEVWDLTPASEYVRPYHLFHRHEESADPQD